MPAFPLARGSGRLAGVLTHPARSSRRGGPPAVFRDSSTYLLTRRGHRRRAAWCVPVFLVSSLSLVVETSSGRKP
jgi:hypothetical protein